VNGVQRHGRRLPRNLPGQQAEPRLHPRIRAARINRDGGIDCDAARRAAALQHRSRLALRCVRPLEKQTLPKSGNISGEHVTGNDQFIFNTALGATNVDAIQAYNARNDTILLDDAVFAALGPPGTLTAGAFNTGSAASQADDRIIYNSATGALLYDADGVGGVAAVQFATLTGVTGVINNTEFLII